MSRGVLRRALAAAILTLAVSACPNVVRVAEPLAPPLPLPEDHLRGEADLSVVWGGGVWRDPGQDWDALLGFAGSGLDIGLGRGVSLNVVGGGSYGGGHLLAWRAAAGPRFRPLRGLVLGVSVSGQLGVLASVPSVGGMLEVAGVAPAGPVYLAGALRGGISGRVHEPRMGIYLLPEVGVLSRPTPELPISFYVSAGGHVGRSVVGRGWRSLELRFTSGVVARLPSARRRAAPDIARVGLGPALACSPP